MGYKRLKVGWLGDVLLLMLLVVVDADTTA